MPALAGHAAVSATSGVSRCGGAAEKKQKIDGGSVSRGAGMLKHSCSPNCVLRLERAGVAGGPLGAVDTSESSSGDARAGTGCLPVLTPY
jgi:hypothetical protein